MMEEETKGEVFQSPPEFQSRLSRSKVSSPKKYFVIVAIIIVVSLLIFGITRFAGSRDQEPTPTPMPTQEVFPTSEPEPTTEDVTPTSEPTKTPTPKPTVNPVDKESGLNRSKLAVQILNGSGEAGVAKKATTLLENLGYNVIQTSNADNFNYEKTTIQIKSAKDGYLALLKKDLSSEYKIGTTSSDLSADTRADAIVTIGKE